MRNLKRQSERLKLYTPISFFFHRSLFAQFLDISYGLCYQFNVAPYADLLRSERAGVGFGLRLVVLIHVGAMSARSHETNYQRFFQQYSPTGVIEYLPTTEKAGLKVAVNTAGEFAQLPSYGFDVQPGSETFIGVTLVRARNSEGDARLKRQHLFSRTRY